MTMLADAIAFAHANREVVGESAFGFLLRCVHITLPWLPSPARRGRYLLRLLTLLLV